jgi:threonylcarbamoyladenosine tRNA methylthiotransferase MtaB
MIRRHLPLACIATDVITGYPGETDETFRDGIDFIRQLELSYMHVFTYSERKNTAASEMTGAVSPHDRRERSRLLHTLSDDKKKQFYQLNAGRTASVFFESENKAGFLYGFTENYIRVRHPWRSDLVNEIKEVVLEQEPNPDFINAVLIPS